MLYIIILSYCIYNHPSHCLAIFAPWLKTSISVVFLLYNHCFPSLTLLSSKMLGFAEEDFCLCSQWEKHITGESVKVIWVLFLGDSFIELDDGKIYRKPLYLMVKTMVSCRFSLKPIHWFLVQIQEYGYLQMVVVIVSENSTSPGTLINLDQFRVVSRARNPIQPMKNHENCALNILNEINVWNNHEKHGQNGYGSKPWYLWSPKLAL